MDTPPQSAGEIAPADPPNDTLAGFLAGQAEIKTLRFLTCGSVDDGKSTLIGRLLYDTRLMFADQIASLARDSDAASGTTGGALDFSLALDGLEAEREQGITIDVAWKYFATARRRFIVADTPGHQQYTRNMATGASGCDLAVVLVDATKGVIEQTRRHALIASLMGIRDIVLAVNKMDLVGYDEAAFEAIRAAFEQATAKHGFAGIVAIPLCARDGDGVVERGAAMAWYRGPTLLEHLETVTPARGTAARPFRMAVQWVNRGFAPERGYAGTIAAGVLRPGDAVLVAGSAQPLRVARIVTMDSERADSERADSERGDSERGGCERRDSERGGCERASAQAGEAVTVLLDRQADVSRGDVLTAADAPIEPADQFEATLVWFAEAALVPGRSYQVKIGTKVVGGTVTAIRSRVDVGTGESAPADTLALNDIGVVEISLSVQAAFESYADGAALGGFVLIDRLSHATVAVGMVARALRSGSNLTWQELSVTRGARARIKGQVPAVVWLTGLSGSGKSTIASELERRLHAQGRHTFVLDGDNVRHGLNRDLGFTEADRVENIRRAAEVARLMVDAGLIVIVSFIAPYAVDRDLARSCLGDAAFLEVFVDTPIEECRRRDTKGLYARADRGEIRNFTGVSAPYEVPASPDLHLRTRGATPGQLAERVIEDLGRRGCLG